MEKLNAYNDPLGFRKFNRYAALALLGLVFFFGIGIALNHFGLPSYVGVKGTEEVSDEAVVIEQMADQVLPGGADSHHGYGGCSE